MEKSPVLGSSSSTCAHNALGTQRLRDFCSAPRIALLQRVLGDSADLHLVGGTVRDVLIARQSADIDLATRLLPAQVLELLSQAGIRAVETGIEHGTLTAVVEGENIEITTFRLPGSRNVFQFSSSIEEDLAGRDFTLNAIAFSLGSKCVIDPYGGIADLEAAMLRAVGDAHERFKEDPHRILRMIRFGPAQGRSIEAATQQAARDLGHTLQTVSVERIKSELEKILLSPHPRQAFFTLRDLGLLPVVLPEILPTINFEQNEFHNEDVFAHTLSVIEGAPQDRIVRLAALFHDLGKPHTLSLDTDGRRHFYKHEEISDRLAQQALERLRFSNDDITSVRTLVALHMRPLECGPAGVRRVIRDLGPHFPRWRDLKIADATPNLDKGDFNRSLERFDRMVEEERTRKVGSPFGTLALNGSDLIALGMKEGPAIGCMLRALNDAVIENPELNTRETLLTEVQKRLASEL